MSSARVTQRAPSISPSCSFSGCAGSATAENPIISERGNGHGCDPRYDTVWTSTPTSSAHSRATHASSDSPASTNPASTE